MTRFFISLHQFFAFRRLTMSSRLYSIRVTQKVTSTFWIWGFWDCSSSSFSCCHVTYVKFSFSSTLLFGAVHMMLGSAGFSPSRARRSGLLGRFRGVAGLTLSVAPAFEAGSRHNLQGKWEKIILLMSVRPFGFFFQSLCYARGLTSKNRDYLLNTILGCSSVKLWMSFLSSTC